MKLDVNVLRYLSKDEFRVLTAVEMGMKNHEIVPTELIERIAGLKHGGAFKDVKTLLRHKLVHHDASKYDGYRLTTLGYDFLAIKTMVNRGLIIAVGRQIGVGKESDIFEVAAEDGSTFALKLHRLGRTSFRAVKSKRDYLKHRNSFNWLYLSRLAALKEYAFMKALGDHGFPIPKAIDWNRHCVLMSLVSGCPLVQVKELQNPSLVFDCVIGLIIRLAESGLIHCDFNEFNILIDDEETITMIDFPQMVSVCHRNAEMYFNRDVECIFKFFKKRFGFSPAVETENGGPPHFKDVANVSGLLDRELAASGFTHQDQEDLEQYACRDIGENEEGNEEQTSDRAGGSGDDDTGQLHTKLQETLYLDVGCQARSQASDVSKEEMTDIDVDEAAIMDAAHQSYSQDIINPDSHDECNDGAQRSFRNSSKTDMLPMKGLMKQRKHVASVSGGSRPHSFRNFSKDKGGRRSRHCVTSEADF